MFDLSKRVAFNSNILSVGTPSSSIVPGAVPSAPDRSPLQDLVVTFTHIPNVDVSVGQALTPITLDGLLPSGDQLFVERSALGSIFGDQRDSGVWAHHRFERYGYQVGLYIGTGANRLELDVNRLREFMARFEFFPGEGLRFGTSTQRTLGSNIRDIHTLLGADVQYVRGPVIVQSEVYWRQTSNQASFVSNDINARGTYVAAAYRTAFASPSTSPSGRRRCESSSHALRHRV